MKESEKQNQYIMRNPKVITFTVPNALEQSNARKIDSNNQTSKPSKEQILDKAFNLHLEGNTKAAIKYYKYCIDNNFNNPKVFMNYGIILKDLGKLKEAEIAQRKAIELKPDFPYGYTSLGMILLRLDKFNEAEQSFRKSIRMNPNDLTANLNLGVVLNYLGKFEESEIYMRKSIKIKSDYPESYNNLSKTLKVLGKLNDAKRFLLQAIKLKPNYADAVFNLSLIQMLQGDYKSGLKNYESRFKKKKKVKPHAQPKIPRWFGESPKKGEKLLIISEQGLGDTIHFMRYIPYLREKGYEVIFCAQEPLLSLIKESGIESNPISPQDANQVLEGKYCPLLSLPLHLGVNQNNPIKVKPYISTKNELIAKWKDIFKEEERPIIGISWQGNPEIERRYVKGRSIALEVFSKLAKTDKFRFVSLQKGFGSEQLETCSFKDKFVKSQELVSRASDFLDTAAHIQNCDLIITTDSCLAHLAGGMGQTTWVLLKALLTWRYGLDETTFWYPSMKLFHQKERDNWDEVMDRIVIELENFLINKNERI